MRSPLENITCEYADLKNISYGAAEDHMAIAINALANYNRMTVKQTLKMIDEIPGEKLAAIIDDLVKII